MMATWTILVVAIAGCGTGDELICAEPEWTLGMEPLGAVLVRAAPDGSLVVATPPGAVVGDLALASPHLLRVTSSGEVTAMVPIATTGGEVPREMHLDGSGGPVIRFGDSNERIVGFDPAFRQKWSKEHTSIAEFDAGPGGETAYWASTSNGDAIYLVDAAGVQRWFRSSSRGFGGPPMPLRVSAAGEVFVFDTSGTRTRRVRVSSEGLTLGEVEFSKFSPDDSFAWIERDGGVVFVGGTDLDSLVRVDAAGANVWASRLDAPVRSPVATPAGEIVAITSRSLLYSGQGRAAAADSTEVVRLDGATGARRATHHNCNAMSADVVFQGEGIVTADEQGYVLFQGTSPAGVARYPMP